MDPFLPVPAPLTTPCPRPMHLPLRTFSTKLASGRPPGQATADKANLQVILRDYRTGHRVSHPGFLVTAVKAQGQRIMLNPKQPILEDPILGQSGMSLTRKKHLLLLPLLHLLRAVIALLWQSGAMKRDGALQFQTWPVCSTLPPCPKCIPGGTADWKLLIDNGSWHTQAVASKKVTWIAVGYPLMKEQGDTRGLWPDTTFHCPAQMCTS